jgi:hypothetical protein
MARAFVVLGIGAEDPIEHVRRKSGWKDRITG